MLHPDVELRRIDDVMGHGLFATRLIPKGTITWTLCPLEQVIPDEDLPQLSSLTQAYLDRYAYSNGRGQRILCCDLGRYMNHSCSPTTLTLPGAEVEVALRDIRAGEQVTDDYGTLCLDDDLHCLCGSDECRGVVRGDDPDTLDASWRLALAPALTAVGRVAQPLGDLVPGGRLAWSVGSLGEPWRHGQRASTG